MTMLTALFSALVAAGAFIRVPMFPVPMTLQTLFVFMAALLLPAKYSFLSMLIYAVLGTIGLPIFTSGGGIAALLSPTGGFIIAFIIASPIGSLLASKKHDSVLWNIFIILIIEVILYSIGLTWLKIKLATTWARAFAVGLTPFIIGDVVKLIVAAFSSKILWPEVQKLSEKLNQREKEA